jgi:hypothetical protein
LYYITVTHRNSIETTSAIPVDFSGAVISYSFDTQSKAYGGNLGLMMDGPAVIYIGDVNQDGMVDGSDLLSISNANDIFMVGYLDEDLNGDGMVDGSDLMICSNNNDNFVVREIPY